MPPHGTRLGGRGLCRDTAGYLGIPVTATTGVLTDGSVITDASGDLIIVVTMATVPNDVPAPAL